MKLEEGIKVVARRGGISNSFSSTKVRLENCYCGRDGFCLSLLVGDQKSTRVNVEISWQTMVGAVAQILRMREGPNQSYLDLRRELNGVVPQKWRTADE